MNSLDLAILVLVFASVLLAFWKGFMHQAIGLGGWIAALLAARLLGTELAPSFAGILVEPKYQLAAAYVVITLVVLLATRVLAAAFGTLMQKIGLGFIDRILGAVFGFVRGLIILVLLVATLSLTSVREAQVWQKSQFMPYLEQLRDWSAGQLEDYSKNR